MSREKKNTKSPFAGIIEIPIICHKNSKNIPTVANFATVQKKGKS